MNVDPSLEPYFREGRLVQIPRHPDTAALRRYLVDEEFMEREAAEYWRAGGTWPIEDP